MKLFRRMGTPPGHRRYRPEIEKHLTRQPGRVTVRFKLRFADGVLDGLLDEGISQIVLNQTFINALSCDEHKRMVLRLPTPNGGEIIITDGIVNSRDDAAVLIRHLRQLGCIAKA